MANKGDTIRLILNYKVNGQPLIQGAYTDIELQLNAYIKENSIQLLLSEGRIVWDSTLGKYTAMLSQQETYQLTEGALDDCNDIQYQMRIYVDNQVSSTMVGTFTIGRVLSNHVFGSTGV